MNFTPHPGSVNKRHLRIPAPKAYRYCPEHTGIAQSIPVRGNQKSVSGDGEYRQIPEIMFWDHFRKKYNEWRFPNWYDT